MWDFVKRVDKWHLSSMSVGLAYISNAAHFSQTATLGHFENSWIDWGALDPPNTTLSHINEEYSCTQGALTHSHARINPRQCPERESLQYISASNMETFPDSGHYLALVSLCLMKKKLFEGLTSLTRIDICFRWRWIVRDCEAASNCNGHGFLAKWTYHIFRT